MRQMLLAVDSAGRCDVSVLLDKLIVTGQELEKLTRAGGRARSFLPDVAEILSREFLPAINEALANCGCDLSPS